MLSFELGKREKKVLHQLWKHWIYIVWKFHFTSVYTRKPERVVYRPNLRPVKKAESGVIEGNFSNWFLEMLQLIWWSIVLDISLPVNVIKEERPHTA